MSDATQSKSCADTAPSCRIPMLFRAFGMSYNFGQLALCTAAVLLIVLGGWFLDRFSQSTAVVRDRSGAIHQSELSAFLAGGMTRKAAADFAATVKSADASSKAGAFEALAAESRDLVNRATAAMLSLRILPDDARRPGLLSAVVAVPGMLWWMFTHHTVYAVFFTLWCLAVMALFGGAATRIAAMQATREESLSAGEAFKFAREKFMSFGLAPLFPWLILAIFGVLMLVGGLLARVPVVDFLAGVIWFVPLLAGLAMAIVFIGALGAWPLMFPVIATEGTEPFDAMSRSYSYVMGRPWRTGLYFLVSLVYGLVSLMVVKLVAFVAFWMVHTSVGLGMNRFEYKTPDGRLMGKLEAMWTAPGTGRHFWGDFNPGNVSDTGWATGWLVSFWSHLLVLVLAGFALSLFISACTLIYLLLRRDYDGTDVSDIWVGDEGDDLFAATGAAADPATQASTSGSVALPVVGTQGGSSPGG